MAPSKKDLSPLEHEIMRIIWDAGPSTASEVQDALAPHSDLKDSTVRTLLRRMEEKGYLSHASEGRTYRYRPCIQPQRAAAQAVRQVIDRFCQGSAESLVMGMVKHEILTPEQLRELARKLEGSKGDEGES